MLILDIKTAARFYCGDVLWVTSYVTNGVNSVFFGRGDVFCHIGVYCEWYNFWVDHK